MNFGGSLRLMVGVCDDGFLSGHGKESISKLIPMFNFCVLSLSATQRTLLPDLMSGPFFGLPRPHRSTLSVVQFTLTRVLRFGLKRFGIKYRS